MSERCRLLLNICSHLLVGSPLFTCRARLHAHRSSLATSSSPLKCCSLPSLTLHLSPPLRFLALVACRSHHLLSNAPPRPPAQRDIPQQSRRSHLGPDQ